MGEAQRQRQTWQHILVEVEGYYEVDQEEVDREVELEISFIPFGEFFNTR